MNFEQKVLAKLMELHNAEPAMLTVINELHERYNWEDVLQKLRLKIKALGIDPDIYPRYLRLT